MRGMAAATTRLRLLIVSDIHLAVKRIANLAEWMQERELRCGAPSCLRDLLAAADSLTVRPCAAIVWRWPLSCWQCGHGGVSRGLLRHERGGPGVGGGRGDGRGSHEPSHFVSGEHQVQSCLCAWKCAFVAW
jgi:hypothetical protein